MTTETVYLLLPECVVIAAAVIIYVAGAFWEDRRHWPWLAGGALVIAAILLGFQEVRATSDSVLAADPLTQFARWLALAFGALLVLQAAHPSARSGTAEYVGSLLLAVAGVMIAVAAKDLVLLFIALELISIPTYILLYLGPGDAASQEAAAKYFFLSILASAMFLYGLAFLYGASGSTDLAEIRQAWTGEAVSARFSALARIAMVLIVAGLSFRMAAVPFHFYAPDVYQGTSYANAAVLSVVPKVAAVFVLVRMLVIAMPLSPTAGTYAWRMALALSVLTMTFANVVALWQDNLRRLLAYSSIAQAGYMLVGLTVALATLGSAQRWDGLSAMLFYLAVYTPASIGSFAVISYLGRREQPLVAVDELAGLGRTHPGAAAVLSVFLFSLAGIPPLAGFWGKLFVFGSAFTVDGRHAGTLWPWFIALAVIGVLNAAIAAAYYLRVVAVMYFRTPLAAPRAEGGRGPWAASVACAVLVVALGIYPWALLAESYRASPTAASAGPEQTASLSR